MTKRQKYTEAPWTFKGRAIYQLQLVKLAEARKYIPEELNVVSFLGYTLGGFYLARYDDSPVGPFEECVALAGIVWNRPTSCAWAARVYVNNREARDHGRSHVGLPSRIATFSDTASSSTRRQPTWWDQALSGHSAEAALQNSDAGKADSSHIMLSNAEERPKWRPWKGPQRDETAPGALCQFSNFPKGAGKLGPRIKLSLPSFSGRTLDEPNMLRYACHLSTNVRPIKPLKVNFYGKRGAKSEGMSHPEDMQSILGGRPVMALAFDRMEMVVHEPLPVIEKLNRDRFQLQEADDARLIVSGRRRPLQTA